MDNKVTKERLNNHLEYDWFKYVIIIIVAVALFVFVFKQINSDRENETLQIYASCYEYRGGDFAERARVVINADNEQAENGKTTIRSVGIEAQNPQSEEYGTLLQTHGDVTSDLLIVGKSYMKNYQYSMLTWDEEVINACTPYKYDENGQKVPAMELTFWEAELNGVSYKRGVRVDNLPNIDLLFGFDPGEIPEDSILNESYENLPEDDKIQYESEQAKYDTEFYLVINPSLVNIGDKGRKGETSDTQTFQLVSKLLWYAQSGVLA